MTNNFKVKTMPGRRQSLDQFDRLPREVKELVWYLPFKAIAEGPVSVNQIELALLAFSADTDRVYGPEHPGATRYRQTLPEDPGF